MGLIFEIFLFAMLAVFLFYRLWMVFGKETEEDQERRDSKFQPSQESENENVVPLPLKNKPVTAPVDEPSEFAPSVRDAIRQIRLIEPNFNPHTFLKGAKAAYQMVIEAFAEGDKKTLEELASKRVYDSFSSAIDEREKQLYKFNSSIESFDKIDIEAIEICDNVVNVAVRYRTRQVNTTTDPQGIIIDNPAKISVNVTDIWTFSRTLNADNPNWELIITKSETYRES